MKLNLTPMQFIGILLVINGALIGSTAQLTDLLGAHMAHIVISVASLGNSVLGGVVTMFTSQGAQTKNVIADPQAQESIVKAVLNMPGVQHIDVNSNANSTLAAIAIDPNVDKIAPTPASQQQVTAIAKAG